MEDRERIPCGHINCIYCRKLYSHTDDDTMFCAFILITGISRPSECTPDCFLHTEDEKLVGNEKLKRIINKEMESNKIVRRKYNEFIEH